MTNYLGAKDETFEKFWTEHQALAPGIFGYVPEVRWFGKETSENPNRDRHYVEARFFEAGSEQSALANCVGAEGQRLFMSRGIATFAVMSPRLGEQSLQKGEELAQALRNAFRGYTTQSAVWYRNGRIQSSFEENLFYRTNFIVEFVFSEVA